MRLPRTGSAKEEFLKEGKRDYLHPEIVDIPIDQGYKKKAWFDFERGTKGNVVKKRRRVQSLYGHQRSQPGIPKADGA